VIKDSRTISESHYHVFKRYFGFLCYNALFVFIVTTSIMETVRPLRGAFAMHDQSSITNQFARQINQPTPHPTPNTQY
jgi:hypothetical protein